MVMRAIAHTKTLRKMPYVSLRGGNSRDRMMSNMEVFIVVFARDVWSISCTLADAVFCNTPCD